MGAGSYLMQGCKKGLMEAQSACNLEPGGVRNVSWVCTPDTVTNRGFETVSRAGECLENKGGEEHCTVGVAPPTCRSRWPSEGTAIRFAEQETRGRRSESTGFTQCTEKCRGQICTRGINKKQKDQTPVKFQKPRFC